MNDYIIMTIRSKPVQVIPELRDISSVTLTPEIAKRLEEPRRDRQRHFCSLCIVCLVILCVLTGAAVHLGFVIVQRTEVWTTSILHHAFLYSSSALILFSWYRYGYWLLRHHRNDDQEIHFFYIPVTGVCHVT